MNALVIRDTGEVERLEYESFAELQKTCGGTVKDGEEVKHVDGSIVESPSILSERFQHLTMWCNEEAQIWGMKVNEVATIVCGWWGRKYPDGSDAYLYGDVVITGPTTRDGSRSTLQPEDAEALELRAGSVLLM